MIRYSAWLLVALSAACGGKASGGAGGSGEPDGGGDVTSTPPASWSPVCPESAPGLGSGCKDEGIACEYGCNGVVVCASGTWGSAVLVGSNGLCDVDASMPSCPTTPAAIASGSTCSIAGEACVQMGATCQCNTSQDPTPDAGNTWFCGPQPGCPLPRPRIGSACTFPTQRCDYQLCGNSQVCTGGVWQPAIGACGG